MNFFVLLVFVSSLCFGLSGCAHSPNGTRSFANQDSAQLHVIVDDYTKASKRLDPFWAPSLGVEDLLDQFGGRPSPEFFQRYKALLTATIEKLKSVHPEALSNSDKILYRLISDDLRILLKGFDFPMQYLEVNQMGNELHDYINDSSKDLTQFPFDTVKHYDAFVKRSEGFPAYVDTLIEVLRQGVREKITLACEPAKKTALTYRDGLEPMIEKNPFFRPIGFMPKEFPEFDRTRLTEAFRTMIRERIIPGYQKFDHFFRTEYLPHCRKGFGIGDLPKDRSWYRYQVLEQTGLDMDPKKIHELGLKEVARITSDMEKIKTEVGFKGSLKSFFKSLREPRYYHRSSQEMFAAFQDVKRRVSAKIPTYFSLVPKSDYAIVENSDANGSPGSYTPPTEMVPHGKFLVNTKNLRSVASYALTSLSLHEAIPGHHFQLSLQFEAKDHLTEYQRKVYWSNAFSEGWGFYAEYLGNDMGMYDDPMLRLGNRVPEMGRALRLVVDTGIHAYGWSRKKAYDYMMAHMPGDSAAIYNEVDRYSVWPGQALGYKLGQLKIIELRRKAEKQLGPKFDLREFHRQVIGNGMVSLNVLEIQINEWIEQVANSEASSILR